MIVEKLVKCYNNVSMLQQAQKNLKQSVIRKKGER